MKLPEFRGKALLKMCGIRVPAGIVVNNKSYVNLSYHKERYKEFFLEHQKVVLKAQVLDGKRKKNNLILHTNNYEESLKLIDNLYKKEWNNLPINTLLIEKELEVKEEYFLSITYDTNERKVRIDFLKEGGIDVESNKTPLASVIVCPLKGLQSYQARELAKQAGFEKRSVLQLAEFIKRAWDCFEKFDCRSLEINPILKTAQGVLVAGDAKITIDENAIIRQQVFHDMTAEDTALTEREHEARRIDAHDHRGVAGKTFIDLDGDIAVLASGGGASLTCMDALVEAGGSPANYTEYSGNPPKEKVQKLTELTLSKPNLNGCFVVGGKANFTDIFETLSGFAEGLKNLKQKPNFPIVVRRAGPRDKEAFEMLQKLSEEQGLNMTLLGEEVPMTKASRIMVEKIKEFKNGNLS